ncbi:hypothetical protein MLD38_004852 [Melastoma candidum]|uniref:Uncharacterized protein n=1 Tax=Melastoma candidum TaxID=119954 RepID=A0ACB9S6X4_9MYRT|nr:hypothetical protein MLD38_004852 [Melastoma candidum]
MTTSTKNIRVTAFLVCLVVLTAAVPRMITPADAARFNERGLQQTDEPICPACVCCEPPPPGQCCQCCAYPNEPSASADP